VPDGGEKDQQASGGAWILAERPSPHSVSQHSVAIATDGRVRHALEITQVLRIEREILVSFGKV
jgi:hypothetical protein